MRRCTIVIPTKIVAFLKQAIESIIYTHEDSEAWEIIVIDDGLTERPAYHHNIKYLEGKKPFCFARNVNIGIASAGSDSDVFLMNDDTFFITKDGLSMLREAICKNGRLGIVTPVFTYPERTPAQRLSHLNPAHGLWIERDRYLTFAAAYLRRELIDEIGYLDEAFTGYGYEDNDYCLRSVLADYELGVLPSVVMGHGNEYGKASLTFRTLPDIPDNRGLFVMKWSSKLFGIGEEHKDQLIRFLGFI